MKKVGSTEGQNGEGDGLDQANPVIPATPPVTVGQILCLMADTEKLSSQASIDNRVIETLWFPHKIGIGSSVIVAITMIL